MPVFTGLRRWNGCVHPHGHAQLSVQKVPHRVAKPLSAQMPPGVQVSSTSVQLYGWACIWHSIRAHGLWIDFFTPLCTTLSQSTLYAPFFKTCVYLQGPTAAIGVLGYQHQHSRAAVLCQCMLQVEIEPPPIDSDDAKKKKRRKGTYFFADD